MQNDRNTLKTIYSLPSGAALRPRWSSHASKRLVDILAAGLGLLLLSPLFAFIAILIKRDSPGPVFYRGPRMGLGGRVFGILKFRTMREEAASYAGPCITAEDDPRITPLGKWLRDTKLNELPQLWNVLVGEMSLVGPRPEDPEIAATWPDAVRREILSVRPGITCPTSIAYHDEEKRLNAANVMDDYLEQILPDKLRLDQLYVRHHSFLTDLDALFWTFVILIPRLNGRSISEGWLFGGPVTRLARRYISWTLIDLCVSFLSLVLLGLLWRIHGPLNLGLPRAALIAGLLSLLFTLFNILLGLKDVAWSRAAADDALGLIVSCSLVTLTILGSQAVFLRGASHGDAPRGLPAGFLFSAGILVLAGFVAARYRLRLVTGLATRWINLRRSGYGAGERALIVGAGEGGEFAAWLLKRPDFRRLYTAVGIADDDPSKQGMRFDGHKVLGTIADIPDLVRRHEISVIFYAINKISTADDQRILATCNRTGARIVMLSEVVSALHHCLDAAGSGTPVPSEPVSIAELADYAVEVEK
jgi:lipopolysaccharide/colanic/teichoic acid biosynthesis glycosyltransferase